MVIFTKHNNDKRIAINPENIIAVIDRGDRTVIHSLISLSAQTDAGLVFYEVNETFDEVMKTILDYHDDKRWRAEQRAKML